MSDRRAELEKKRLKLEMLRAARKTNHENIDSGQTNTQSTTAPKDRLLETDEILKNLGIPLVDTTNQQQGKSPASNQEPATLKEPEGAKRSTVLSISKVTQTNIPPKDIVAYNKETQTIKEINEKNDEDGESETGPESSPKVPISTPHKPPPQEEDKPSVEEKPVIREMTEEQSKTILMSEDFQVFFNKASSIVERTLAENIDVFTDYTGLDKDDNDRQLNEGEQLKINRSFHFDKWSKNRSVTSLDWSTQFPELLLASYNNNEDLPQEPDGVVLVWNTKFKKTSPEYIFHYQSPVTSACFAKFHPNLIIGGTFSGHIVLWDNRSNKRTPVQRTPISASVHTHPVYCLDVVGSKNAHNLASISTDGKMCFWNLDMLSQPQESMELQQKQSKSAAALCLSFACGDSNNFVVGSEEGVVYSACRHGNKTGIMDVFEGHQGPVAGIDYHNVLGSVDFSSYFISSSFDWTVKLWNIREKAPVHSFEDNSDYVYDAKWSPTHPAIFSTVDGSGRLDLWNLNVDLEAPTTSTTIDSGLALNKCRWHQSGHNIGVGDDQGGVHIYEVAESLANPRSDDWSKFSSSLQELKQEQQDQLDSFKTSSYSTASL